MMGASNGVSVVRAEGIQDVWKSNLEEEFEKIRQVVKRYPYIAMDTEFPGVVAKPVGDFPSQNDYQYQLLRCNVDLLKIIQIGLSFFDEHGKSPRGISTWQFNFKFNLSADTYAQESIELLQNSGIQFSRHDDEGIEPEVFAIKLITSGIILFDEVTFLSFHSGYDFGYLLRMLTNKAMPVDEANFFELLPEYFPVIYDIKYLMKSCKNLKGGLQEVSEQLELERVGPQHQAGSDSLLTGHTFFKMRDLYFEGHIDQEKYCGHLYGLGTQYVQNGNAETVLSQTIQQAQLNVASFSGFSIADPNAVHHLVNPTAAASAAAAQAAAEASNSDQEGEPAPAGETQNKE